MNVLELKKAFENFSDNVDVVAVFTWKGETVMDELINISNNNGNVQLNLESFVNDSKGKDG